MSRPIDDLSDELLTALIAAYPRHVASRVDAGGWDGLDLADAVAEGTAWLETALRELLAQRFAEQRRGPLELFQEAMRFPTQRLAEAGAAPVARDEVTVRALPGDQYGLAPASSRDLGEDVWEVHLRWGAAKAAAVTGGQVADAADGRDET